MAENQTGVAQSAPQTPEAETAKAAVRSALESDEFQAELRSLVANVVGDNETAAAAAKAALKEYRPVSYDPFRAPIRFVAGIIAFSLALFVGLLNAWPSDDDSPLVPFLNTMIAWTAIVIFVATLVMLVIQVQKFLNGRKGFGAWLTVLMMLVAVAFGLPSALYAFNLGYPPSPDGVRVTLWQAIDQSVCEVRLVLAIPPC